MNKISGANVLRLLDRLFLKARPTSFLTNGRPVSVSRCFRKQRETETGRPFVRNDVGRALRKRRSRSRSTLAPEILFIGWRLRAVLMTILCDHYLSCRGPDWSANSTCCNSQISARHNQVAPHRVCSPERVRAPRSEERR